jgi:cell division protein FtsI (penicillin-binding protein 3)
MPDRRYIGFFALLALAALGVLIRYGVLMLGKSGPEQTRQSQIFAERGAILDRNGRILALQIKLANVSVWKPNITDTESLATELSPMLEMPEQEIIDKINASSSPFLYLKRQVDESAIRMINSGIQAKKIPGVSLEPIVGRIYPEQTLASTVIGFAGYENDGLAGIEYAFDDELLGIQNNGKGSHIVLTIDSNIQYTLETIAEKARKETEAEAVMFLAMDPRTGDILGSASLPDFDPNNIQISTDEQRMDRPASWPYEPGSVFKVFSMATLLDSGAISGNSAFTCNGSYERVTNRGERIQINCLGSHGQVDVRKIIIHSCNAGAAYASDRIDSGTFNESLRNFGFGDKTGAGNPAETRGFLWPLERWSDRSKPTIAMGQEISVSALQMLQAASVIANDGVMVSPRIVSHIISADGKEIKNWNPGENHRVIKPETARAMRSYMVDVTSDIGTGWRARVEDLSLAVKTGTAQIIDPVTRRYSSTDFIASCVALLPAESPSLILYLAIIRPQGEIYGGRIAAPWIREAAEKLVDYAGIPRGRNPQINHSSTITLPLDKLPEINTIMPDLTGLSKRTLLPLLYRDDIHAEILGEGWVVRQSPPAGTPLAENPMIILELE